MNLGNLGNIQYIVIVGYFNYRFLAVSGNGVFCDNGCRRKELGEKAKI